MLHVSIKAEEIFNFLGVSVTNSLLASSIVVVLFLLIGVYFSKNIDSNSKPIFFIRFIISKLYETFEPILGHLTPQVFPLVASIFMFVLMANWLGLLPGFGSITYQKPHVVAVHEEAVIDEHAVENMQVDTGVEHEVEETAHDTESVAEETHQDAALAEAGHADVPTPLLRGATADLNMTIALAVLAFLAIQYYGFKELGLSYIGKFITFKGPIDFFSGILELISEFSKIISFAFRLFGNVYAGEVLLAVIAFLIPVLASFPFLLLEVFVGFIQAIVFAMLTAVFINSATAKHH